MNLTKKLKEIFNNKTLTSVIIVGTINFSGCANNQPQFNSHNNFQKTHKLKKISKELLEVFFISL